MLRNSKPDLAKDFLRGNFQYKIKHDDESRLAHWLLLPAIMNVMAESNAAEL